MIFFWNENFKLSGVMISSNFRKILLIIYDVEYKEICILFRI